MLSPRDLVKMSLGRNTFRQEVRNAIFKGQDENLATRPPIFETEAEIMNLTKVRIQEIVLSLSDDSIMTAEGLQVLLDNL